MSQIILAADSVGAKILAKPVSGIREAIEKAGSTVLYLSPYSPDFSQARKLLV